MIINSIRNTVRDFFLFCWTWSTQISLVKCPKSLTGSQIRLRREIPGCRQTRDAHAISMRTCQKCSPNGPKAPLSDSLLNRSGCETSSSLSTDAVTCCWSSHVISTCASVQKNKQKSSSADTNAVIYTSTIKYWIHAVNVTSNYYKSCLTKIITIIIVIHLNKAKI